MRISDWSSDVCSSDLSACASWRCATAGTCRASRRTGNRRSAPCPDLRRRHVAALHDAQRRVAGVAGEYLAEPVVAHAPYQQLRQHAAEVGGDRDVAEVGREDFRVQPLPAAVELAAVD